LAQNCPRHGHHGHDVTNFGQIMKMKGKTTIYHNETLESTKYKSMVAIISLHFSGWWLLWAVMAITMVSSLHDN
jgi:hypothetical protein